MTANWKNTTLGALCAVNPDKRGVDWPHSVIQYIDISSVGTGFFNTPPRAISLGEAPSRAQRLVEAEDTIISTVRPNRRSFLFLRCPTPNTVVSTGFCVLRAREGKVDPRFLYYLVNQESFTDYLVSRAEGSAYPAVNPSVLEEAEIRVPPYPEQRAIARILGALDDKIEINRKMNETLESIAQTLFQSWFVDFAPVHAKSKGHTPGLPPQIADLFPNKFEDSKLGRIPKGWTVKSLDKIAEFLNGMALQKHPPGSGELGLPVIKIAELRNGITNRSDRASADIPEKYIIENGDILFSWSASLMQTIWTGGLGALNQHLFKVSSLEYPQWFHYFWVDKHLPGFQAIAAGKATSMGHIQRHHLTEARTVLPDAHLLQAADAHIAPLFAQIVSTAQSTHALTTIRDAMLPKLLSGELRIKA